MADNDKRHVSKPPIVVTATGEHPAVVMPAPSRTMLIFGLVLDLVALVGIIVLLAIKVLTPGEGLPVIFVLLGIKVAAVAKGSPPSASALLSILGILKAIR